jgi:hypothetical protein
MKHTIKITTLLLLVLAFVVSCSKDDSTDSGGQYEAFAFQADEVINKVPQGLKNSDNPYAEDCYEAIEQAVDMSSFVALMEPPANAQVVNTKSTEGSVTYTWTETYDGQTYTYIWIYSDDATKNYYTMQIQINGGPIYNFVDAWEFKDGNKGQVKFNFNYIYCSYYTDYEFECEDLYWTYTWEITASGRYNFSYYIDSGIDDYSYSLRIDIVLEADGSGSIDYYSADELFWHMEWDSIGNGSYTYYYGGYEESGSWTV